MSVLIEATSVLIKKSVIDNKWLGGWQAFVQDVPNQTLYFDNMLVRVGFMSDAYAKSYVEKLIEKGVVCFSDDGIDDLAIVNQLQSVYID